MDWAGRMQFFLSSQCSRQLSLLPTARDDNALLEFFRRDAAVKAFDQQASFSLARRFEKGRTLCGMAARTQAGQGKGGKNYASVALSSQDSAGDGHDAHHSRSPPRLTPRPRVLDWRARPPRSRTEELLAKGQNLEARVRRTISSLDRRDYTSVLCELHAMAAWAEDLKRDRQLN